MAKPKKTPEEVAEQLSALRSQIEDDVAAMTPQQRRDLRDRTKHSPETIAAASAAIGMSNNVSAALGMTSEDMRELMMLAIRWEKVEQDLQALYNGVSSANLRRRHRLNLIADHVFAVTKQLVRSGSEQLVSIYEEMERLRKVERQKKTRKPKEAPPEET
ncbi:MAG TPA: hypothetical protein VHU41_13930 [Thermoanaerobaculia bacterium]|nr:hypothetical protein [Thermoanaerobaculia bacterium]